MAYDEELATRLGGFGKVLNPGMTGMGQVAFDRERELELLLRRFARQPIKSFILVGKSGCGKTAVLGELVRRLDRDFDPSWITLSTAASQLLAGTRYLGELETRTRSLVEAARRPNRVVLYFTDLFALSDAGRSSNSDISIGSHLAPHIESGEIVVVGECTPEQYRAGFEKNPAFKKLFDLVQLPEQDEEVSRRVVRQLADRACEKFRADRNARLVVADDVLDRIFELSDSFFPLQCYPGKAVQLLEQVIAIETDEETGRKPTRGELAIRPEAAVTALHRFTGIPDNLLDDSKQLDMDGVRRFFESRVLGQSEAIESIVDLITLIKAGCTDPGKPMGVYFFVGPTGVGKTELAKALAEFIFGSPDRMLRFDMSEYKDYNSFEKLIGNPQAREDSPQQAGSLVSRVRQEPFCVILLDEIEKAHSNIFDLFLQVFDDGRLTDPIGRTTNFTQTIIIMTSNAGSNILNDKSFGLKPAERDLREDISESMKGLFRPEFLNRIGRTVFFHPLTREHMRTIAERELNAVLGRSGIARRNLRIDVDPGVIDILLKEGFSPAFGARPLKRAVERLALIPIARQVVKLRKSSQEALMRLSAVGDRIRVTLVQPEDRRAEKATSTTVTFVDPVRKKKTRVTLDQIALQVAELRAQVDALDEMCRGQQLRERKKELVDQTGEADFWDDPAGARGVLGEIHRLERMLHAFDGIGKRMEDLESLVDRSREDRQPPLLAQAAEQIHEVRRHVELMGYSLQCRGPRDRCDAYVTISLVDATPPEDDLVGILGDMYANWARSKGFEVSFIHEELTAPEKTLELTLLIEGMSVYGVLQGEDGIHEMVYGRTSKVEKHARFLKVSVRALVEDDPPELLQGQVEIKRRPIRGEGRHIKRFRTLIQATQQPSMVTVHCRSGLEGDEATQAVRDLLRAEFCRRKLPLAGERDATPDGATEDIIRRYTLRPNQVVKDQRTGTRITGLDDLWNGALDQFLHAHLEMRLTGRTAPSTGQDADQDDVETGDGDSADAASQPPPFLSRTASRKAAQNGEPDPTRDAEADPDEGQPMESKH